MDKVYEHVLKQPPEEQLLSIALAFLDNLPEMVNYLFEHKEETELILAKSEGTKHAHFIEKMKMHEADLIFERVEWTTIQRRTAKGENPDKIVPASKQTVDLLMESYFSMTVNAVLQGDDPKKVCRVMEEITTFYYGGFSAIINRQPQYWIHLDGEN